MWCYKYPKLTHWPQKETILHCLPFVYLQRAAVANALTTRIISLYIIMYNRIPLLYTVHAAFTIMQQ